MNDEGRMIGKISYLNEKGYGFIESKQDSIFFHAKGLLVSDFKDLSVGTKVDFKKTETEKGFRAERIIIVEDVG